MVGENAGDQCRIVLGQCGNKVLVDADGQRFESFEDVVFAVDVGRQSCRSVFFLLMVWTADFKAAPKAVSCVMSFVFL